MRRDSRPAFESRPLTPACYDDFERLFGAKGACGGCWCQWWKQTGAEFKKLKGSANRRAMRTYVDGGQIPGLLAYANGEPIGWCAVEPRSRYPRLSRSRTLAPVDDAAAWSVTCFYVARPWRRKRVMTGLLRAAVAYVREQGGSIIEGYPVDPRKDVVPDLFVFPGLTSAFLEAGFSEVLRRSDTRPIMRYSLRRPVP